MPFAVNTPNGQVHLMDLPLEVLDRLEGETGMRWTEIILAPASSAKCAIAVYQVACEQTGSEPEQLSPRKLIDDNVIENVPDDLPEMYEDGVPKAGGAESTGGSSGEPNDMDGPPT